MRVKVVVDLDIELDNLNDIAENADERHPQTKRLLAAAVEAINNALTFATPEGFKHSMQESASININEVVLA